MKKIDIPIKINNIDMDSLVISGNNDLIVNGQTINPNLISIKNKSENNILLSKEELIYLYNLYNQNKFNNYEKCLIGTILSNRDLYQDLAYIFDCSVDEITDNSDEVAKNPNKYVVLLNNFYSDYRYNKNNKYRLKYIYGYLDCHFNYGNTDMFSSLEIVGSYVNIDNNKKNLNLNKLKYVGGEFYIVDLTESNSLTNLEYIGGNADFANLTEVTGLKNLSVVLGYAGFDGIKNADGLNNLKYIGGDAAFLSLKDAQGLENLRYIGKDAKFNSLSESTGLNKLQIIGGYALFNELIDASSLYNLRYIGGNAYFRKLEIATGLDSLTIIEGEAWFDSLKNATDLKNLVYCRDIKMSNRENSKIKKKIKLAYWNK